MTRSNTAIFIFGMVMFTSPGFAQSMDTIEELKVCARMKDEDARLACFDKLGERVLREEPVSSKPTLEETIQPETATESATIVMPLPDELGNSKTAQYVGLITSCKKGQFGDLYFIFDNDQVWKDVTSRNL